MEGVAFGWSALPGGLLFPELVFFRMDFGRSHSDSAVELIQTNF